MAQDRPSSLPQVQCEEFEGPLDLLLDEVRRQNVDIENVAMAPIVSRFLDYVAAASSRNLNLDIEWLHMAAILIHWKSQSLLPAIPGTKGPDRVRETLVQQLLLHRRQAAEELDRRKSVAENRFSRTESRQIETQLPEEPAGISVWDLVQQARELAVWAIRHRAERSHWKEFGVERDDVTVSEMVDHLREQFPLWTGRVEGTKVLLQHPSASRRACLFLGMLELAREQAIEVEQNEPFGEFWLRVR